MNHSWLSARAYCHSQNAELISLNSFEEYVFVMDILRTWSWDIYLRSRIVYIGITMAVGAFDNVVLPANIFLPPETSR